MEIGQHLIISRTDNIGDVLLSLPMATIIKQRYPACKISFLARDYVKDIIQHCSDVDAFISWDELQLLPPDVAVEKLKDLKVDTIIHAFPNKKLAKLAKSAAIKNRIGTSHRLYHWFTCNQRVNFTRKNSKLHEAQLNLKLLPPLGIDANVPLESLQSLISLTPSPTIAEAVKVFLDDNRFNLVIHPLTNGNTKEWPLQHFSELISLLPRDKFNIVISGTAKEKKTLEPLLSSHPHVKDAIGKLRLTEFIDLLGHANGIVANSTGPLHIAAALGINALGLFPPEKGKDPARWGPIGKQAMFIEAQECESCKNKSDKCICMDSILPQTVKAIVEKWPHNAYSQCST